MRTFDFLRSICHVERPCGAFAVAFQLCKFRGSLAILLAALAGVADLHAAESLQTFVSRLMQGKAGAIIVSDPRTGRILAMWNPQSAFKEAYTPGSTAKLVVSAATLEEGLISPSERILCRRVPRLLGESFHCSHPPAAQPFDLAGALANSCNYFFCGVEHSALLLCSGPLVCSVWFRRRRRRVFARRSTHPG